MRMDSRWSFGVLVFSALSFGSVQFEARTQLFSFTGVCKEGPSRSSLKDNILSVGIQLACFKTGFDSRDKHMLEDLGADKQSTASMIVKLSADSFGGTLFLNGLSRPVSGAVLKSPARLVFKVFLSDFNIPARRHLGVQVQEEVLVTAELESKQ